MKNYYWSAKSLNFYPVEDKEKYASAGFDLSDVVLVDDPVFNSFGINQPAGKKRGAGRDGMPVWVDVPAQTKEQYTITASGIKSDLLALAAIKMAPLQDAADPDVNMATEKEKNLLTEWKKYRVLLSRIDASKAPDIEWPVAPE
jgi:hypothetical protein